MEGDGELDFAAILAGAEVTSSVLKRVDAPSPVVSGNDARSEPLIVGTLPDVDSTTISEVVDSPVRAVTPWRRYGAVAYLVAADSIALLAADFVLGFEFWANVIALMAGIWTMSMLGLYHSRLHPSLLDDIPRLIVGAFVAVSVGTIATVSLTGTFELNFAAPHVLMLLAAILLVRASFYITLRHARRSGRARHATIVVGAGHVGIRLTNALREYRVYGLDPVGFLDSDPRVARPDELPVPVLGSWHDIAKVVRQHKISRVIVAFASVPEYEVVDILRTSARLECEIYYVPRLFELHNTSREVDDVRGIPLVRLRRSAFRSMSWRLKRIFDIVVAGGLLVLVSPMMAVCAIAVRLEGGHGVLFRQQRIGLDGRSFEMLKFRSMKPTSDNEALTRWTIKNDDRVGRVGRILRSTSLDEIPQLWNVLIGDMSLVGPRPERPHFVTHFSAEVPRYNSRHRVPAGITGWAQINRLRGDTSIAERALFDNYYIENWSLWWDVKILLRTAVQVLRGCGE